MAADDVERWVRALADEHPETVTDAAARLLEQPQLARPRLVELVRRGAADQQTRWAVRLLGQLGDSADVALLAGLLADGSSPLAWEAAQALGRHRSQAARDSLVRATGSDDPEVVGAAAVALGARGDEATRATLERLLDDPSESVRYRAVHALGLLGAEASGEALAAARERDTSPHVRASIGELLVPPPGAV